MEPFDATKTRNRMVELEAKRRDILAKMQAELKPVDEEMRKLIEACQHQPVGSGDGKRCMYCGKYL